ncbi:MAG: [protein-PII] uridylyltransferase [Rhodospirillales bacterium]
MTSSNTAVAERRAGPKSVAAAAFSVEEWRRPLRETLDHFVSWSGYKAADRPVVLDAFKKALNAGYEAVKNDFETKKLPASIAIRRRALVVDMIVEELYRFTETAVYPSNTPTTGERIAVIATGGYGRGELAPYSDIDLMFLMPHKLGPRIEQVVEYMLYLMWDLGLTVGHATRNIDEAIRQARDDLSIRTAVLEARHLIGDADLFESFRIRFESDVMQDSELAFVEGKLAERDERHAKMGDTRYVLEPNVKEGKGGLRDLQTLFWIAKYIYKVDTMADLVALGVFTDTDVRLFDKAANFIWTVRTHLHELAGRADDRLTFDLQPEIGRRMGYTDHAGTTGVERFMKHYFLIAKDVGDLTRILCAVLEEQQKKGRRRFSLPSFGFGRRKETGDDAFNFENGRISVSDKNAFDEQPSRLITLFRIAHENDADIHPNTLRLVKQSLGRIDHDLQDDPVANKAFLELLCAKKNPEWMLMAMNEAGVFGRFVPDFGRVVAQMQFDMYHVYTVDEHTIRALGILSRIENGELAADHPVSARVIKEVQSRRVLYVAVLLHDIAKGRKGDHSELGAEIALTLCPRFGLNEWETETVSWLVRHHLLMSMTAFKRDLDDPQAIRDFTAQVQSPERLRLLLILTVADIRAVGPKVWNAWKAELLRDLYYRAQEVLSGESGEDSRAFRIRQAQAQLAESLADNWTPDDIERFKAIGRDTFWLAFDTETHARQAEIVRRAWQTGNLFDIVTSVDTERDITEIFVYAPDHPGLFANIAGAMAVSGASIVDAKIVTLTDGMALDTFWVQDENGRAFDDEGRLQRLRDRVDKTVKGEIRAGREIEKARERSLPRRARHFLVPPRVLIDNEASGDSTVIEVNCRDRLGLLYDVTSALTKNRLQISSAHISTFGERVVDVFYVRDPFGLKVRDERRIKDLRQALLDAAEGDATGDEATRSAWSVDMAAADRGPEERPEGATLTAPTKS